MQLTNKQSEGLRIAVDRYNAHEPFTTISGYAGSGKSTLISYIIAALNLDSAQDVAYIAFTGKASEVLRRKGCPNATTAHKLLYYSKQMSNGRFMFRPRPYLENDYKIIVVDEVSMLPVDMWNLLLSHGIYVLACGDPFQLPPIDKSKDNHVLDTPHVFLDEIMRQAQESDIIRVSMDIREGRKLNAFKGNDIQIFSRTDLVDGMYTWADQILCATNRTRGEINEYMREKLELLPEPSIGDKIICLQNCWDLVSENEENPLINGTIGFIEDMEETEITYILDGHFINAPVLLTTVKVGNDLFTRVPIDYQALTTGEKFFTGKQEYALRRNKENPVLPIEFNYGYSITCHKAQGSEWDKVLVMEEGFPFDKTEHARWLYTAVTRASAKCTVMLK